MADRPVHEITLRLSGGGLATILAVMAAIFVAGAVAVLVLAVQISSLSNELDEPTRLQSQRETQCLLARHDPSLVPYIDFDTCPKE
jgi:hypothetical protein